MRAREIDPERGQSLHGCLTTDSRSSEVYLGSAGPWVPGSACLFCSHTAIGVFRPIASFCHFLLVSGWFLPSLMLLVGFPAVSVANSVPLLTCCRWVISSRLLRFSKYLLLSCWFPPLLRLLAWLPTVSILPEFLSLATFLVIGKSPKFLFLLCLFTEVVDLGFKGPFWVFHPLQSLFCAFSHYDLCLLVIYCFTIMRESSKRLVATESGIEEVLLEIYPIISHNLELT